MHIKHISDNDTHTDQSQQEIDGGSSGKKRFSGEMSENMDSDQKCDPKENAMPGWQSRSYREGPTQVTGQRWVARYRSCTFLPSLAGPEASDPLPIAGLRTCPSHV